MLDHWSPATGRAPPFGFTLCAERLSTAESGGPDAATIAGYMTYMCVDTASGQAAHRGLAVEILDDATGTLALESSADYPVSAKPSSSPAGTWMT